MARAWEMTDGEIYTNYRQAKDRRAQIRIIADMNVKPINAVICKLLDMGFEDKWLYKYHSDYYSKWTDDEVEKLIRLRADGWEWKEIAVMMRRTLNSCKRKMKEVRKNEVI